MRKWFLFEHATCAPMRDGKPQRGIIAAHLVEDDELICETEDVTLMRDAQTPNGFVLACVSCLAVSEVPQ